MVQDYKYTKPRKPCMAMFSSPGPIYGLPPLTGQPNHDIRRSRGPAYVLGQKFGGELKLLGPGPKYLLEPKVQICGVELSPAYTMGKRSAMKVINQSPGPAAYAGDTSTISRHAPAYEFGIKHLELKQKKTPGPEYTLPPMMGRTLESKNPSCPMPVIGKEKPNKKFNTYPGPGTYPAVPMTVYLTKEPHYTMPARSFGVSNKTYIPGPGAYCPERARNYPAVPHFSFGIRHSRYEGNAVEAAAQEPIDCPV